jgi:hypothetical protein
MSFAEIGGTGVDSPTASIKVVEKVVDSTSVVEDVEITGDVGDVEPPVEIVAIDGGDDELVVDKVGAGDNVVGAGVTVALRTSREFCVVVRTGVTVVVAPGRVVARVVVASVVASVTATV